MKNIWEKVKDFTSPYATDDDYDDYDEDLDDGFGEEEPAPRRPRAEREPRRERRAPVTEDVSDDTTAVPGSAAASFSSAASATASTSSPLGFSGHVVGSVNSHKQQMVLVRPETFADATVIAGSLREKRGVVLNLEGVDKALARRVVDFLSGCAFALDGNVKKVAAATYVFCPNNMEITGDLKNLTADAESYV